MIDVINQYAFQVSDFPVILSIENHCSIKQQKKMASIMRRLFGPALLTEPLGDLSASELPSPNQLKNKILIKGKCFNTFQPHADGDDEGEVSEEDEAADDLSFLTHMCQSKSETDQFENESNEQLLPNSDCEFTFKNMERSISQEPRRRFKHKLLKKQSSLISMKESVMNMVQSVSNSNISSPKIKFTKKRSKKLKLCAEFSDLVVYFKSFNFRGLDNPDQKYYNICSFNEKRAKSLIQSSSRMIDHHQNNVSRIYPDATRIKSSNFDPTIFWSNGFQMVAINYQTSGFERDLYLGHFKQNGNCGYVKKPDFIYF